MKKILLILLLSSAHCPSFAQNGAAIDSLIGEGISYHDKGEYNEAIAKYDAALALDKNNLIALAEKAFSLLSLQKYSESVRICEKAIALHPGEKGLNTVYVTYGNATDGLQKSERAIQIYDEGLKLFPDYYQLYFNKGIALGGQKRFDEAMRSLRRSAILNPAHAGTHNAIARICFAEHKKIPSLLAYCRFFSLDPTSGRAKENLTNLRKIMSGNAKETGKNSITISIDPDMLADTAVGGKHKANSFSSTDLLLTMDAALDFDEKNKGKTEVEQFIRKFESVCASLKETKEDNHGFFWSYYAPYFMEMRDKHFVETFAYIAFASSDDPGVEQWLKAHHPETRKFLEWSKSFVWQAD